ncbi:hypothetical protein VTL71DRAFT_2549 [Oculimacula yallundae]|uniref:Uncharacterized protein n=1 Tax=Oculimacula yallundae TaxID=86028 RepID=A0ABR4C977_9HELO
MINAIPTIAVKFLAEVLSGDKSTRVLALVSGSNSPMFYVPSLYDRLSVSALKCYFGSLKPLGTTGTEQDPQNEYSHPRPIPSHPLHPPTSPSKGVPTTNSCCPFYLQILCRNVGLCQLVLHTSFNNFLDPLLRSFEASSSLEFTIDYTPRTSVSSIQTHNRSC